MASALLWAARRLDPDPLAWRERAYEFVADRRAVDLLFGSDVPRRLIDDGAPWPELLAALDEGLEAFRERRRDWLLY